MKLPQQHKNTLRYGIGTLLALVLAAGIYAYVAHSHSWWPFVKSTNTTQSKQDVLSTNTPADKKNAPTTKTNNNVDSTKTTDQIPTNPSLALTITKLEQQNGNVTYQAELNDKAQTGTCAAEFTSPGARPVTSTTNATNGVCGPVNIPELQFTKIGDWTLTLRYYTNNTQVSTQQTFTVH